MDVIKLQKRSNDLFVSYGGSDLERVRQLVDLLKHKCVLSVWFDGLEGNAAVRSSELIAGAIGNSRGALFCLSEAWIESTWCRIEHEASRREQREQRGFEIICLRLDDVKPPNWFNVAEIVDMREISPAAIARLLRSLSSDVPHRFDNAYDTYLAAPWSRPSRLVKETFDVLRLTGWRLVGDTQNLKHLREERIESIQRTTRGVVAIMPHDPSQPSGATSPYILQEAQLAVKIGKPLLLLAEPHVVLPENLVRAAFRTTSFTLESGEQGHKKLKTLLDDFDDTLQHVPHTNAGAFVFFAASLQGDPSEADDIATVIERASNMRCIRGERLSGVNAQSAIIELIRHAAVVIADVSDDHRNTLIEAGIAMGSGTMLKLLCRHPLPGSPLKKRFMFEGQEIHWYCTPEQRLGLCYYFARQFRRQVYVQR